MRVNAEKLYLGLCRSCASIQKWRFFSCYSVKSLQVFKALEAVLLTVLQVFFVTSSISEERKQTEVSTLLALPFPHTRTPHSRSLVITRPQLKVQAKNSYC